MNMHIVKKVSIVLTFGICLAMFAWFNFSVSEALPFMPIGLFFGLLPYLIYRYLRFREIKEMEDAFPEFLRGLAEAQRSGINLPQAIINASRIDYGALTKEIRKMAAQLSWGVPLPKVLEMFSERVKESNFLRRSIAIILEAYRTGGNVAEVMDSVAESARMVKELEAERRSKFNQQLMIMYAIYIIFLIIIVALNRILLPMFALSGAQEIAGVSLGFASLDPAFFRTIFLHMILMQAVFAGLIAGQVGEGSIIAGIKHSIVMIALGTVVFTFFLPQQQFIISVETPYEVFSPGSIYEINGFVLTFDKTPVPDADVKISVAGKVYKTKTDDLGGFSERIVLPTKPGRYTIKIEAKGREGEGSYSYEVSVG